MRRGSSLTGVEGSKNFLRSRALSCARAQAEEPSITISNTPIFVFLTRIIVTRILLAPKQRSGQGKNRNRAFVNPSMRLSESAEDPGTRSRQPGPGGRVVL